MILQKMEKEVEMANDKAYKEKALCRYAVQKQLDKTKSVETVLRNYADSLAENNAELRRELKVALEEKRATMKSSAKAKRLAVDCLDKWHKEQSRRRYAEDYAVRQERVAIEVESMLSNYESIIQESESKKHCFKKE